MYLNLINEDARFLQKYLWKQKLPLKIKIFMWFLCGKVLLTKDNLVKCKWKGCSKCCFYDLNEMVQHLFISCSFVRIIWHMIDFTYNLRPLSNITNVFRNWLKGISKADKARIRIGVSALRWSIWICQNNIIFNKQKDTIFAGYPVGCTLDSPMVLPPPSGSAGAYRYWMQPVADFFSRLLDGGILIKMKMDSVLSLLILRWLIHVSILADL
jgi:hypothetical protein